MSYTFTNNPAGSNRDLLRTLLKDTSSGSAKFSDEALDWFLANSANVWYAAAEAADGLAAHLVSGGGSKQVGDLRIDYAGGAAGWRSAAQRWRIRGNRDAKPFAGGVTVSDKDTEKADTNRAAPAFSVGMHDYTGSTY